MTPAQLVTADFTQAPNGLECEPDGGIVGRVASGGNSVLLQAVPTTWPKPIGQFRLAQSDRDYADSTVQRHYQQP